MNMLLNKVAIITGASSGIGRSTALLFAKEGAKVVLGARRQKELDSLVHEIKQNGGEAVAIVGNVKDESYHQALVDLATNKYSRLDIAFNNAGIIGKIDEVSNISLEEWRETIDVNLTSTFLAAKYQLPLMSKNGGSMIFTSSFVGHTVGLPNLSAYAASKAGIIGLTKVLASEYASKKVRVNALLPGGTDTPMREETAGTPEALEFLENLHAQKRLATSDEMAQSVLYLASDASSFTTGTAMLVDGGLSISKI